MPLYYTTVTLLFLVVVASILDPKVLYYLSLKVQLGIIGIKRLYMMFILHPRNIFTTWSINRRITKLTKQLESELENGNPTKLPPRVGGGKQGPK
jgi:hypothetical protein